MSKQLTRREIIAQAKDKGHDIRPAAYKVNRKTVYKVKGYPGVYSLQWVAFNLLSIPL